MNNKTKGCKPKNRMLGVSLGVSSTREAEAALHETARSADIAELRLDFMEEYDLPRLLNSRPCPVIVTNRPEREGGRFNGSEEARVEPLLQAIALGADYVDIEHDSTHLIGDRKQTQLIVSYHDFKLMPDNFPEIYSQLATKNADVVKIVGTAQSVLDNLPILDALAQADRPTIAIAMGEPGLISRILALRYDTCLLTYANLGSGEVVAPGQLPLSVMTEAYKSRSINDNTRIFGIISRHTVPIELINSLNATTHAVTGAFIWIPLVTPNLSSESLGKIIGEFSKLNINGYFIDESAQDAIRPDAYEINSPWEADRINVLMHLKDRFVGERVSTIDEASILFDQVL